jgi:protease I
MLNGKRVAILVAEGFEQSEMVEPRKALEQAGAETEIVSPAQDEVQGWNHFDKADRFNVDVPVEQANADDYDALLLPGGVANPDQLRTNPKAVQFVQRFFEAAKPVGVICHGPWTLIEAGAVRGRTLTSWPSAAWCRAASPTTSRRSAASSSRRSARAATLAGARPSFEFRKGAEPSFPRKRESMFLDLR